MSKAFVKESDDLEDDIQPEGGDEARAAKNYISPGGYRRLRAEFSALWEVERPKLVETIAWAASNGDRSENGDYIYGKRRLREVDRRIRYLSKRIEIAEVVDNAAQGHDRVFFGATVTYQDSSGGARTVTVVGIDEAEPSRGRISWISPVAKALMKAREGDVVPVRTPAGIDEIEVIEIRYEAID
ncbi:MAG: transcription elongation factor GreB [Burkholderiales bacterium]|jgi:transcription elongation factor GreB|nr:transcription elongation factor GreB [Burkholderiales bacterium]